MTNEMCTFEDSDLLERYAQGDPAAFEAFFLRHRGRVYFYLYRRVHRPEIALELTQEVFLKLHSKIHYYQPTHQALSWFFTIVHNTCVDHMRKCASENKAGGGSLEQQAVELVAHTEESAVGTVSGAAERVIDGLKSLPAEQRKIVEARTLGERSFADLANEAGKSEPALRKAYSRALQRLRSFLNSESNSDGEK